MTELIIAVLQGRATAAQQRELVAWRAASPENERLYQDIATTWQITEAGAVEVGAGREPGVRDILKRSTARRGAVLPLPGAAPRRRWQGRLLVAAAVLVGILGMGRLWLWAPEERQAEVRTEEAETTTIHLADGSVVRLGPDSRLRFDPAGHTREVWLDGHAFFAVAHAAQQFVVRTAAGDATVLGTRFDLTAREDELSLLVVDGRVALSAAGRRVELGGGERGVASAAAGLAVETVDDPLVHLDWMGRALLFQSTPLTQVARQIERAYGVRVVIEDSTLAHRTLTGSFTNRSFDHVLSVVCEVLSLGCTIEGDAARIHGVAPPPAARPVLVGPQ
jgi:transmembrane sensor